MHTTLKRLQHPECVAPPPTWAVTTIFPRPSSTTGTKQLELVCFSGDQDLFLIEIGADRFLRKLRTYTSDL